MSFLFPFFLSVLLITGLFYWLTISNRIILTFTQGMLVLFVKCIVGCIYGYLFFTIYKGDDTWQYHQLSLQEYNVLKSNPLYFITDLFQHHYQNSQVLTFFNSESSYWKDLQYNLLIKMLAIFNLLSGGHYYINVLYFNVITFWGHYFLYKLLIAQFPSKKQILFLIIFLFPPLLFWESGIRKDGLIFPAITGSIYYFIQLLNERNKAKYFIICFISFLFVFLIRNFVALSLIPVFVAYFITVKYNKKAISVTVITLSVCVSLFFLTIFAPDSLNLPKQMAERQHKFLELKGNSFLPIKPLNDKILSYVEDFPTSINHSFFRPYITEVKSPLLLVSAIENLLMILMLILALINYKIFIGILRNPLWIMLISFSVINYLIIGYTVPFFGAIIRYRILFEVFLLTPFIICADKNNYLTKQLSRIRLLKKLN